MAGPWFPRPPRPAGRVAGCVAGAAGLSGTGGCSAATSGNASAAARNDLTIGFETLTVPPPNAPSIQPLHPDVLVMDLAPRVVRLQRERPAPRQPLAPRVLRLRPLGHDLAVDRDRHRLVL